MFTCNGGGSASSATSTGQRFWLWVALAAVLAIGWPGVAAHAQDGTAGAQDVVNAAQGQMAQGELVPAQTAAESPGQTDPPSQVARIGVLMGNVSVEPASVDQFSAAELNYPMTTGDRIYADTGANAELQTGQLAVRLGQQTDLTVTAMTDTLAQFGLAQGSVHLRSYSQTTGGLDAGETVELDTPNVAVTVLQPGDVRVDVDPASDTTTVALLSGQVEVDGNGLQQVLHAGQRVRLAGSDPVSTQWLDAGAADGLDSFSSDRDGVYESAAAGQSDFVSPETIGAEDLEGNGDWQTDETYGAVWFPSGVAVGWVPYSCGRWAWVAPWGWSWVGCESWGFAPFHYGRWVQRGPRWGWVPGRPGLRPVYAPALVVFAGGSDFRVGGVAVTGWFPLGPGEPYVPWYHASALYENRLNVADFNTRNLAEARRIYNDRSDVYGADAGRQYVNRALATVAVARTSFAAGRPVAGSALRLSPEQATEAQLLPHPLVTPERSIVTPSPARALPAHVARPMLASREETGQQPQTAVQPEQVGGVVQGSVQGSVPSQRQSVSRGHAQTPAAQNAAGQNAAGQNPDSHPESQDRTAPGSETQTPTAEVIGANGEVEQQPRRVPEPGGVAAQRPLFNRAIPPPSRPSFEEQQKAIESVDPGRPLGPRQMQNLRENQPAGPPQQREIPHPAPMPPPRPQPAPRYNPPPAPKR